MKGLLILGQIYSARSVSVASGLEELLVRLGAQTGFSGAGAQTEDSSAAGAQTPPPPPPPNAGTGSGHIRIDEASAKALVLGVEELSVKDLKALMVRLEAEGQGQGQGSNLLEKRDLQQYCKRLLCAKLSDAALAHVLGLRAEAGAEAGALSREALIEQILAARG